MIIVRISNNFNAIDNAYSKFYESHIAFEENVTNENKMRTLDRLKLLEEKIKIYKNSLKNIYITKDDYSIKID